MTLSLKLLLTVKSAILAFFLIATNFFIDAYEEFDYADSLVACCKTHLAIYNNELKRSGSYKEVSENKFMFYYFKIILYKILEHSDDDVLKYCAVWF